MAETDIRAAGTEGAGAFAVEIQGVSVSYGQTLAIRDLSMHVPRGAIYGLLGPSGAGKTTIMRILATLQQPDSGTGWVDGINIWTDPAAVRERIGYLPDFAGVYEDLTVREFLDFYGALNQVPTRQRRQSTDDLLELIGLTDQQNRPVKLLSRGTKQQLGLARCLIHNPSVLLLDEPAAGMDPRSRLELRDILQELARLGKTVLMSSNLLSEVAEVCTHLAFMRGGELVAEGETSEIMSAVSPEPHLRVGLLEVSDREAARAVLEAHPACRQIETASESELTARFSGTRQDLAAVLEQLCTRGIAVTELALEHPALEEVFLVMTGTGPKE